MNEQSQRVLIFLIAMGPLLSLPLEGATNPANGQESRAKSTSQHAAADALPEAFLRPAPESVDDLQTIQEHVVKLVPRLLNCTVSLRIGHAQGSGVIVSAEGHVLTAAHVSGPPGRRISIVTNDGKRYQGVTLGRNSTLDASMIKIESDRKNWPYVSLSTEPVKPGEWCAALGHPNGYQADRGLVLRLGRVILKNNWLVQSDCELIGGDSGGPLFNMRGEVIGINTRIGENTEYNFHVPAEAYLRDWKRLVASEDFHTHSGAYLGISGTPNTEGLGLVITDVYEGEPAEHAGVRAGDILLTFQGTKVTDLNQLIQLVGDERPGKSVTLGILRDGQPMDVTVRLAMRLD